MPQKFHELLCALADGNFHSGEELGRAMGISRTAVWKHLQKLEELELSVEKAKGRGYRVPGGYELLCSDSIFAELSDGAKDLLKTIEIFHSVDSTNTVVRGYADQVDSTGHVVLAERQVNGRGRRGRTWVSPFARNLYLSLVWGFEGGASELEGLSLAVGIAVRRALIQCGVESIQLKWPNDILHQNNKLGGILLEMIGDPSGFCQVVIGVGINVDMPVGSGRAIDQQWIDLRRASGQRISRNLLAARLLNHMLPVLHTYPERGFAGIRSEWEQNDAYRGKTVCLVTPGKEICGVADGVSDTGSICLLINGKRHFFNGGEISLRTADVSVGSNRDS